MQSGGKYYFEIKIIQGSLIKFGICRYNFPKDQAFCDSDEGFGIYNGELRHGNCFTGKKYASGKSKIKSGDTISVLLDMVEGTLSFKKNGIYLGVAFKDEELKYGLFYPAVAPVYEDDCF